MRCRSHGSAQGGCATITASTVEVERQGLDGQARGLALHGQQLRFEVGPNRSRVSGHRSARRPCPVVARRQAQTIGS